MRAGLLKGWDEVNLALGHASEWFKALPSADKMTFDELSRCSKYFASGASECRSRQALGQRRRLEKKSVVDYSYSLRLHFVNIGFIAQKRVDSLFCRRSQSSPGNSRMCYVTVAAELS